ncbi:hypothetical protein Droror1_Dr00025580, partial [Drosera rotundifolia]
MFAFSPPAKMLSIDELATMRDAEEAATLRTQHLSGMRSSVLMDAEDGVAARWCVFRRLGGEDRLDAEDGVISGDGCRGWGLRWSPPPVTSPSHFSAAQTIISVSHLSFLSPPSRFRFGLRFVFK